MSALQMIPIDCIEVLNPRERNNRIFEVIVDNIKTLGLKKPVTVTPAAGAAAAAVNTTTRMRKAITPCFPASVF